MIAWLLIPEHNALLTWVAFAIGIVGFVLALAGIGLTLWQVRAIKSETEATTTAVATVQFKVSALDVAQECKSASETINRIRSALRNDNLLEMLNNYERLIGYFLNIRHAPIIMDDSDRAIMQKHTDDMAKICEAIRRKMSSQEASTTLRGQDRALRNFLDSVTKISFIMSRSLSGE